DITRSRASATPSRAGSVKPAGSHAPMLTSTTGGGRTCTAEVAGEPKHPAERDVGGPDEPLHGTTALRAKSAHVTLPVAGERSQHQVRRRDVRSPIVDHEEPATGAERLRLPAGEGAFQVDDH